MDDIVERFDGLVDTVSTVMRHEAAKSYALDLREMYLLVDGAKELKAEIERLRAELKHEKEMADQHFRTARELCTVAIGFEPTAIHYPSTVEEAVEHMEEVRAELKGHKPKRRRPPDEVWEAVEEVFYPSGVADGERKHVNRIVRDLKQKRATGYEVRKRAENYRRNWPKMAMTAEALLRNWDVHAQGPPGGSGKAAERRRAEWMAQLERERAEAVRDPEGWSEGLEEMRQARRRR